MQIKIEKQSMAILALFVGVPIVFVVFLALMSGPKDSARIEQEANWSGDEVEISVEASTISPSVITIPAGRDVLLKVENSGASGCTNSLISRDLFDGSIILGAKGDEVTKIIRADKPGSYSITCWMGMADLTVKAI